MKATRLIVSDVAAADILEQADWYQVQSGRALAERWEKAVTAAVLRIVKKPNSGFLCVLPSPELHGVRRSAVTGFPKHLIFYRFTEGEVFVLRVVHGARDLEHLL